MAGSLWRHRDFLLLWLGQSVSRLGDQFTGLAIPIIAVFSLQAGTTQMGLLGAFGSVPFLLFGLPVGVWVDRRQRRSVLIRADLGRGAMIAVIALLAFGSLLRMEFLYGFAFVIGVLTVFFDVAYQAYLPALVETQQLVDANSKLETSNSLANLSGPALAGFVIHTLSAAIAMVFDAISFFFSASTLWAIRRREPAPEPTAQRSLLREIRDGLDVVLRDRRLWHIAGCTAWSNFFSNWVFAALIILYLKNNLGLDALSIGVLFAIGSLGGLVGAVTASRIANRIGVGWTIILGAVVFGFAFLPFPLITGPLAFVVAALGIFGTSFGSLVYNINQVSFRQAIVPRALQGRLNATMRTIVWGTLPLGALAGGYAGTLVSLQLALLLGILGGSVAFLWVLISPVRDVRTMPEAVA